MTSALKHISAIGYRLLLALFFSVFAMHAQAACTFFDGFVDNKNGTVTDPRSGLVWKRCGEGFEWNGNACLGEAKVVDWFEAMKAAKDSEFLGMKWRLPSLQEVKAVTGTYDNCRNQDYKSGQYAASNTIAHASLPNGNITGYWTSTRDGNSAWLGGFANGSHWSLPADIKGAAGLSYRLVASGKNLTSSEFEKNYDSKTINKKTHEAGEYRSQQARREQAERDEQWRRDIPARQARQMCEAQKATCFASCPPYRSVHHTENSLIVNGSHFDCKQRCEGINCN